ncbi:MAG: hypothetical protein AAF623_19755 [Planctomycetota bacterium]
MQRIQLKIWVGDSTGCDDGRSSAPANQKSDKNAALSISAISNEYRVNLPITIQ